MSERVLLKMECGRLPNKLIQISIVIILNMKMRRRINVSKINSVGPVLIIIAFSYIANLIIASAQIVRMGGLLIE